MNNAENKKRVWQKIIRPIALCLALIFLLSCATYAWMKRDWHATIEEEGVKIVAGASLTFLFDDNTVETTNINKLLGLGEDTFVFKSVSNCSGQSEDFFALDYSMMGPNYDTLNKLLLEEELSEEERNGSAPYTMLGKKYGYLDLTFTIGSADNNTKEIYFDAASCIEPSGALAAGEIDPSKAIRMSLTVYDGDTQEVHYIFTNNGSTHSGINNEYANGHGYLANGARLYSDGGEKMTNFYHSVLKEEYPLNKSPLADSVKNFSDWGEGTLFTISNGQQKTIKVRIWLEGEDANCVDDIAGDELNLLLKFAARNAVDQGS